MTIGGKQMAVRDIMRTPATVQEGVTFREVIKKMIVDKTNSLVVVDKDGKCIGLVNPKALIKHVVPDYLEEDSIAAHFVSEGIFREEAAKVEGAPIEEFMQKREDFDVLEADDSLMQAAVIALKNNQVRIPVVDEDGKPIGLLTRTEIKNVIGAFLGIDEAFGQ